MNPIMINAFFDEIEKIKEAGAMKNIGDGALGLGKAMVSNARNTLTAFATPIKSMKTGFSASGGTFGKTMVGVGAALGAPEAFAKEDPTGGNRSRTERISGWAGEQAGGLIGAPHGMFTGSIVGSVMGKGIGRATGKAVNKAVNYTTGYGAGPAKVTGQLPNEAYGTPFE